MRKILRIKAAFAAAIFIGFIFVSSAFAAAANSPLYIFLLIGDGMGKNQYIAAQKKGLTKYIDSLPLKGEVTTLAFNKVITDSAAAATALATGEKTRDGMLGLNAEGEIVQNVTEVAIQRGMGTGIITSMSLNHATPAGFYAHIKSRTSYYDIGTQLISSGVNYFGGGGFHRNTGRNKNMPGLYALAEKAGYEVFMNGKIPDINKLKGGKNKIISVNPKLRSDSCMPYAEKRPKNGRHLSDFTKEAIQILSDNKSGFFILIEGGNIDYACHDNEFNRMLSEIADFDGAVAEALNFYYERPENTLVIVTGDHETGGLQIDAENGNPIKWSTKYHTRANVPLFAIGVNSDAFLGASGIIDNTDIAKNLFRMIENRRGE